MRDAFAKGHVDAVITDHNLPRFDSFASLTVAKSIDADIPVIVLSGEMSEDLAVAALHAGADDFVLKTRMFRIASALQHSLQAANARRDARTAVAALAQSEGKLHALTQHLERAKEEERRAIAQEIHDDIGGALTALKFELVRLTRALPDAECAAAARCDVATARIGRRRQPSDSACAAAGRARCRSRCRARVAGARIFRAQRNRGRFAGQPRRVRDCAGPRGRGVSRRAGGADKHSQTRARQARSHATVRARRRNNARNRRRWRRFRHEQPASDAGIWRQWNDRASARARGMGGSIFIARPRHDGDVLDSDARGSIQPTS